ncbi:MAG: hypothetical protein HFP77_08620 [Methylococcales symbiont of Iophon sp. n. MRB-2018]|nr:MAG: hypothetical protein HFP77_08620 [Methylococcales symbiont of Iophon sp. n. MRB-2018]KAF3980196.1 MAG: hypothetical protein HFP76_03335 [Methylococcales symbiont of Iophon sp. n. MRB-2018]
MKRLLYPIQQITLNKRGLVALFGVDFVSRFYQKNDQEIAVILPNTACFFYGFFNLLLQIRWLLYF